MAFNIFTYTRQLNITKHTAVVLTMVIFVSLSIILLQTGTVDLQSGMMAHCPFMEHGQAMCPMTLSDHLNRWHSLFAATTPSIDALLVASLIITTIISIFLYWFVRIDRTDQFYHYHSYQREHDVQPRFNRLFKLLARGIIHPRIYPASIK